MLNVINQCLQIVKAYGETERKLTQPEINMLEHVSGTIQEQLVEIEVQNDADEVRSEYKQRISEMLQRDADKTKALVTEFKELAGLVAMLPDQLVYKGKFQGSIENIKEILEND